MTNILDQLSQVDQTVADGASAKLLELTQKGVPFKDAIKSLSDMLADPTQVKALAQPTTAPAVA